MTHFSLASIPVNKQCPFLQLSRKLLYLFLSQVNKTISMLVKKIVFIKCQELFEQTRLKIETPHSMIIDHIQNENTLEIESVSQPYHMKIRQI